MFENSAGASTHTYKKNWRKTKNGSKRNFSNGAHANERQQQKKNSSSLNCDEKMRQNEWESNVRKGREKKTHTHTEPTFGARKIPRANVPH